jgi:hypothetical protein
MAPTQAAAETAARGTTPSVATFLVAASATGGLFPIHALFDANGSREHDAIDGATRRTLVRLRSDIRAQWQSVDAWTALQQSSREAVGGADPMVQQVDLGLRASMGQGPDVGPLPADARRIDTVAKFRLAELA